MKKKILAITLCVAMVAIMLVSGTLAYFTDEADQTNTFTAGKVDILLYEQTVAKDNNTQSERYGDLVATGTITYEDQSYELFPGMIVDKDPTIQVKSDSEDAFLAAKVTVTTTEGDVWDLIGAKHYDGAHMLALQGFLTGGCANVGAEPQSQYPMNGKNGVYVYGDGTYSVWQEIKQENGKYTYVFYVFIEGAKSAGTPVKLFEQMHINKDWTNDQMKIMNGLTIKVDAYGVQANGFANCYEAMVGAFGQAAGDPFYFG